MKVSFVVPCYRLAHVLPECLESILKQSFQDFEILVMDDCSPDDTPQVAARFSDPRVIHVRHAKNLGHLRNYNNGIERARGEYVWLISADDSLRSPDVLRRFVDLLDRHPQVMFAFCQAMKVRDGRDVSWYPRSAPKDITHGERFLAEALLDYNCIPAPGALARKSAYLRAGLFPMDLPHSADWFLWCCFALYGDVAHVAEPLVNYRQHDESMSKTFSAQKLEALVANEIAVRWRLKRLAARAGQTRLVKACRRTIAEDYARRIRTNDPQRGVFGMTPAAVESSIEASAASPRERDLTRADVYECRGDAARAARTFAAAREMYAHTLRTDPLRPKTWLKYATSRVRGPFSGAADAAGVRAVDAPSTSGSLR